MTRITEQSMIDCGAILTREDAAILARFDERHRHQCRWGDRKDAALMQLADAKSSIKREVNRIINGGNP